MYVKGKPNCLMEGTRESRSRSIYKWKQQMREVAFQITEEMLSLIYGDGFLHTNQIM